MPRLFCFQNNRQAGLCRFRIGGLLRGAARHWPRLVDGAAYLTWSAASPVLQGGVKSADGAAVLG